MDSRTRAILVLLVLACGFTVISYNLIQIQLVGHDRYGQMARENHEHLEILPPRRGTIYDADNNVLAESQRVYDVSLDGALESDGAHLAAVAAALGEPVSKVTEAFNPKNRNIVLAEGLSVDDPAIERLHDLKLRSVIVTPRDERTYPNTELASHVLGFIDDGTGRSLVE